MRGMIPHKNACCKCISRGITLVKYARVKSIANALSKSEGVLGITYGKTIRSTNTLQTDVTSHQFDRLALRGTK